ncbi:MAG: DUF4331 domain-containing protein [Candidatus Dormibacteraeota bacterium]|nr:DUF4331 domain-containing protein [Candidatus Dormibacteraeota bacterium]
MSSHREAPGISKDPVADNTDTYAFVSPENDGTVTIITNYVPLEGPAGGPNFYEFGDDVLYAINIDNDGDGIPNVTYQFRFTTTVTNPNTFLYNRGPIGSLTDAAWIRRQTYSVRRITSHGNDDDSTDDHGDDHNTLLGTGLPCPPCNIGPHSTPHYADLASAAVNPLPGGRTVFAGQRREGFYVDLGSIFDLGDLRPLQSHFAYTPNSSDANGVNATKALNVHSIALKVPISDLTRDGSTPSSVTDSRSVVGIWGAAYRQKSRVFDDDSKVHESGPWAQVSRLGMPLINEVIIPMASKDYWNTQRPSKDSQFAQYVLHPELAGLLNGLYPGAFPHLAALSAPRLDLQLVLMQGIPSGVVKEFQNSTGSTVADMLRLNVAIPAAAQSDPKFSPIGVVAGDLAGFPNGRRVFDDVVTVELQAIAGLLYPKIDSSYHVDGVVTSVTDGLGPDFSMYQSTFPYLGLPLDGFDNPSV